jgi:hypothetical protein
VRQNACGVGADDTGAWEQCGGEKKMQREVEEEEEEKRGIRNEAMIDIIATGTTRIKPLQDSK